MLPTGVVGGWLTVRDGWGGGVVRKNVGLAGGWTGGFATDLGGAGFVADGGSVQSGRGACAWADWIGQDSNITSPQAICAKPNRAAADSSFAAMT